MTALTTKERQEALRARRAMLGMTEVRGVYLPPDLHPVLKSFAQRLARKAAKQADDSLPDPRDAGDVPGGQKP